MALQFQTQNHTKELLVTRNKTFFVLFLPAFLVQTFIFAQPSPPNPTGPITFTLPAKLKDRIDDHADLRYPKPPLLDQKESDQGLVNDQDHCPQDASFQTLSGLDLVKELKDLSRSDNSTCTYYWPRLGGQDYCYYRVGERHWLGWRVGPLFHWVLFWKGHLWWHDIFAERWIFFEGGHWWWQSEGDKPTFHIYLPDGHYHVCDVNGSLGDDMGATGKVETITEPRPKEINHHNSNRENRDLDSMN